ncbi:MAG: HD domain-containing protein [Chloroflexi bacterium]|nr:HD domain-containing protein [Chloroflexota bacterium]
MSRVEVIYLIPYFVSLLLALSVFVYTWSRRSAQGAAAFAWHTAGQSLWIAGFILELISIHLSEKMFWDGFQWVAGSVSLIAMPVFAVQYTEQRLKNPRTIFLLSFVVPVCFTVTLLFDHYLHLVFLNPRVIQGTSFLELAYDFTPMIYFYALYNYGVTLWALFIMIQKISRPHSLYRSQISIIAIGFAIPVLSTVFSLLDFPSAAQRDPTPFAMAIGNIIIAWGLFRFRLFEVVPIARDRVFEAMVEPVVILDKQNMIVDVNSSMLALLGKNENEVIGKSAKNVFEDFPIPIKMYTHVSYARTEATYELGGLNIHYELTVWPIYNARKEMVGRIYISHDITALKQLENELRKLNTELEDRVRARTWELADAYDTTLEGWARTLELRDKETEGHSRRVTDTTLKIAMAMGIKDDYLEQIRRGAILHDIGKMGIPDGILHKPGTLTDEERDIIRKHPQIAYDLLSPVPFLKKALEIPYCHHERWDGMGYPQGLKEHAIPMSARIFAIADVWDAISSDRPYNKAWSREKAVEYFIKEAGRHFDPRVVNVFLDLVEKGEI